MSRTSFHELVAVFKEKLYMKKLKSVLRVFLCLLWITPFGLVARASTEKEPTPVGGWGIPAKQQEFNTQIYHFLRTNQMDELQRFIEQVPDCSEADEAEVDMCTPDRTDGKPYLQHIELRNVNEKSDSKIVFVDRGIYDAITAWYKTLYGADPKTLNQAAYKDFYNRYRGTWLAPQIEETLILRWQPGVVFDGVVNFPKVTGKGIFTTLYVAKLLQVDGYKYISPNLRFQKYSGNAFYTKWLSILLEMEKLGKQTNSSEIVRELKSTWLDSLLAPELGGECSYYEGRKQKYIIEFFNKFGMGLFMNDGNTPTKWQKHTATLYARACERTPRISAKSCELYREGITKYGLNEDADRQKVVGEQTRLAVQEAIKEKQKGR